MKDNTAAIHLALIDEVASVLSDAGIDHWLFGGWAVDFLVGQTTRTHSDVEFVAWHRDLPAITRILQTSGYSPIGVRYPDDGAAFSKNDQRLGFIFIDETADGQIVTPGRWGDWPWPEGSFAGVRGRLGDIELPVVSLEGQLETKENYHRQPEGRPLRKKDRSDIQHLRRLANSSTSIPQPSGWGTGFST